MLIKLLHTCGKLWGHYDGFTILFLRLKKEIYLRTFLKALTKTISS